MADNLTREKRSKVMSSIRGKNTRPELTVRKQLWSAGLRYRIHDRTIPGTPDISIKGRKIAIFVDGCFWHGCRRCYREPSSNVGFWRAKIQNNKTRRRRVRSRLRKGGWTVLEFWEHQIYANPHEIANTIENCLK